MRARAVVVVIVLLAVGALVAAGARAEDVRVAVVPGEPRDRVGPARGEAPPAWTVELPLGWTARAPEAPGSESELVLVGGVHDGVRTTVVIGRAGADQPLGPALAADAVARSGGRRVLRGEAASTRVAGLPALVFDQLDAGPPAVIVRTVVLDGAGAGGARMTASAAIAAEAFEAEVVLVDAALQSWQVTAPTA